MDKKGLLANEDIRYVVFLLVLSGLFFLPAVLHPNSLIYPTFSPHSDLTVIHWPKERLLTESVERYGQFPLWSPLILSGMPLMSNQLAMLFYPLNVLFLLLPLNLAFNLLFIIHIFLAGAGLYLFMRRGLGTSGLAATIAALSFMFTGKLLAHVAGGHVSMVGTVAWLPWAFLFTHLALSKKEVLYSLLAGLALALQVTTHTQILVYTAYALLAYSLGQMWASRRADGWLTSLTSSLKVLAPIPLVFVLLGAVQILPLVEMTPYSNRALSLSEASAYSLSPLTLFVGLFLPSHRAGHELTVYLAFLPLVLALLAVVRERSRPVLFFGGLALFGLIFTLGTATPLFTIVYYLLPGLRWVRTPSRAIFFVALAVAVLAGYGFDVLTAKGWNIRARRRLTLAGIAVVLVCLLLAVGLLFFYGQVSRATVGLAVFPSLSIGLVILGASRRGFPSRISRTGLHSHAPMKPTERTEKEKQAFVAAPDAWDNTTQSASSVTKIRVGWFHISVRPLGAVMVAVLLLDLWSFDHSLLLLASQEEAFAPQREVAEYLAAQPGVFRVYSPSYSLPPHVAARFGLQLVDGVEPVHLARYDEFMSLAGGYPLDSFSVTIPPFPQGQEIAEAHRHTRPHLALLGLLNARYLAAEFPMESEHLKLKKQIGRTYVYENELALPRAFVVFQTRPAPAITLDELTASFDPEALALVEGGRDLDGAGPFQEATITRLTPDEMVVNVELEAPGFLVLSEMWYPGWRAYDNGRPVPLYRTDYVLRGLYLDPGPHTVQVVYEPWTFKVGFWISLGCAAGLTLYLLIKAFRRL